MTHSDALEFSGRQALIRSIMTTRACMDRSSDTPCDEEMKDLLLRGAKELSRLPSEAALIVAEAIEADMNTFNRVLTWITTSPDMPVRHYFAQILRDYSEALAQPEEIKNVG